MVELLLPYLNNMISKAWGSASQAQHPLKTDIVRWQFPLFKGTTCRNNGRSAWNGSHLEHISAFYMEITNIHGVKWKMSCFNDIKIDLSGFVVTMHLGLCKQYFKSFSLSASGFDFLFSTHPRALWQQSTPEPVLIP